jgi:acyl dehydratase
MADQDSSTAAATGSEAPPEKVYPRISTEDIERARRQIGIPQYERNEVFNRVATSDTISHFAFGIGDDNPLFHDPEYGKSTRWRGQIGSPLYLTTVGIDETPPPNAELKELFRGLFRGVGKYYSGAKWEWFKPVRPGDVLYREYTTCNIEVKEQSSFTGGITVIDTYRFFYVNQLGEPVATHEMAFVNAERGASKKTGKNEKIERATYTPEEIAKIGEQYAAEERRGAKTRYWEDVSEGDQLVPVVKGPLRVTDVVGFHIGWGFGQTYGAGPLRYGWKQRSRMPAFYSDDPYGVPDIVQRLHWDPARANEIGLPAPYDYGTMRTNWLGHLVTNWMGDDGILLRLQTEMRAFNFVGDTTLCTGEIARKYVENGQHLVDLKLAATNQRGVVTSPGTATVALPSKTGGAAILPIAPFEFRQRGADMMAEASIRLRG